MDKARAASGMVDRLFAPLAGQAGALGGAGNAAKASIEQQSADQKAQQQQTEEQRRQAHEDLQDKIALAQANSQMLHSQSLLHLTGNEAIDKGIADGQRTVATLKAQPAPGIVVGDNLTSDDLRDMLQKGTFNASEMTPYPTGKVVVRTDEDGVPQYRSTYTLMRLPKEVRITNPLEAKELFPDKNLGIVGTDSPLVIPGTMYNQVVQQKETRTAAALAAKKAASDRQDEETAAQIKAESAQFAQDGVWVNALASARGNQFKALDAIQSNPDLAKKYPHIQQDVMTLYGYKNQAEYEKARHDREEEDRQNREDAQRETDRKQAKLDKQRGDVAQKDFEDALARHDGNVLAAVADLKQNHASSYATLLRQEIEAGGTTAVSTDEEGNKITVKSRPSIFGAAGPAQTPTPAEETPANPAAAQFQKNQQAQQKAVEQDQAAKDAAYNGRPAEPEYVAGGMGQVAANPEYNEAEKYLRQHPELTDPKDRAAVRTQYQKDQNQAALPKAPQPGAKIDANTAARYLAASGGDKNKARAAAQAAGWNF